jgi:hypothetical protein
MRGISFSLAAGICLLGFSAAAADAPLALTGLVANPLHLSLADLRALPPTHITATQVSGHGPVPLDCSGVLLSALLQQAQPQFGAANNAGLAHTLLVMGDDGYAISLSFGEIDANYGRVAPLIATECGGKELAGPRFVVPGDIHAGRSVQGVVSIEVK